MADAGSALMGIGTDERREPRGRGRQRQAISSPLLESSVEGATGILLNITGARDLGLFEVNEAAEIISSAADPNSNIIFGAVIDEGMGDEVRVTVIATGFDDAARGSQRPAREPPARRGPGPQPGDRRPPALVARDPRRRDRHPARSCATATDARSTATAGSHRLRALGDLRRPLRVSRGGPCRAARSTGRRFSLPSPPHMAAGETTTSSARRCSSATRRRARSSCRSRAGRCRSSTDGIREEHVAVRDSGGRLRRLATWARSRRAARRRRAASSTCSPTTSRKIAVGGAQYSVLCREDGGVLDDLFTYRLGRGPLPHGHQRRQPRQGLRAGSGLRRAPTSTPRSIDRAADYAMLAVQGPTRPRDRPGARRRAAARRASTRRERIVAGAETLVCGTGYTGEDGVELLIAPDDAAARLGARSLNAGAVPARPRRARHPAPRGLLPPLRQRPDARSAARSRPGWAGACKEDTGFIGSDAVARRSAQQGPAEMLVPFVIDGPGIARQGNPVVGRRRGDERHASPCLERRHRHGLRARRARRAGHRASRSTSAGKHAPRRSRPTSPSTPRDIRTATPMADESYPDDLLLPPRARLGPDRRRHRHVRHHLVRPGRARRGRVLRPARRSARRSRRTSPTPRSSRSRPSRDVYRAALRRDRRGQRGALGRARRRSTTTRTATGWLVKVRLSDQIRARGAAWTSRPTARLYSDLTTRRRHWRRRHGGSPYEPVHARHRRRPSRRCSPRSAWTRSTTCSPTSRRACASTARSTCPDGLSEQEVYAHLRELAEQATSRPRTRSRFLGAGMYDHYVPALVDMHHGPLGVPDAVHALPAGDLARAACR